MLCTNQRSFLTVLILLAAGGNAQADVEVSPSLALRNTTGFFYQRAQLSGITHGWTGLTDLRARPRLQIVADSVSFGLEIETQGRLSTDSNAASSGSSVLGQASPLRLHPLGGAAVNENGVTLKAWIDRADLSFSAGPLDIQIGRQPISLGTANFIGVLDVVAPFAPGDLDSTFKPGVDAVRIRTPIAQTGELELIAVGADPLDWSGFVLRTRFQMRNFDLELLAGRLRERWFGGTGWQGELGKIEFWGEFAGFEHKNEFVFAGSDAMAFSGISGFNIRVPKDIILGAAGFYQDFGVRKPIDLPQFYLSEIALEGWLFLGSAGYAVGTYLQELTPLLNLNAAVVINAVDGSTLWQPSLAYNLSDSTDISLFGWVATGKTPRSQNLVPEIRSEFGASPSGFGLYSRWFF